MTISADEDQVGKGEEAGKAWELRHLSRKIKHFLSSTFPESISLPAKYSKIRLLQGEQCLMERVIMKTPSRKHLPNCHLLLMFAKRDL
jgi:hypothetical protein